MQDLNIKVLDNLTDLQAKTEAKLQDMKAELSLMPHTLGVAVRSMEVMEENIKMQQKE